MDKQGARNLESRYEVIGDAADLNADDLAAVIGIIWKSRLAEGLPEGPAQTGD